MNGYAVAYVYQSGYDYTMINNQTHTRIGLVCVALFTVFSVAALAEDFAIRDGDTVVFLGDSITAARYYGEIIENYTLLRYPKLKVRFINAGHGGETMEGGAARLERDVLNQGATLITVAYGINDIGWGLKADDEHKQKYLNGIRSIVEQCKKRNVRVFICSAAITGQDPVISENEYLQKMCDEGLKLTRSLGAGTIDVQRSMREIQKRVWAANAQAKEDKDKVTMHAADTIHLNDLGQVAMAFAILKGLGAPAEVSSVTIDAAAVKLVEAKGCAVTKVGREGDALTFDRLDDGLPLNLDALWELHFRFIPIPDQLNRYMLTVRNLDPGNYDLVVDDRPVSTFTNEQLSTGVNISSTKPDPWEPGGPWDAQARLIQSLTESRSHLDVANSHMAAYLKANPNQPAIIQLGQDVVNSRLEDLQRVTARPVPYRYVLRPAAPPPAK